MPWKQVAVTLNTIIHTGGSEGTLQLYGQLDVSKIKDATSAVPQVLESKNYWFRSINDPETYIEDYGLTIDKREDFILRPGQALLFTGSLWDQDDFGDDHFPVHERRLKYEDINESSQEYDFIVRAVEQPFDPLDSAIVQVYFKVQHISGGTI